jgi:PKHD-type hydroxylase
MYLQNYYSIKESVFDNNFCNKIIKKGESLEIKAAEVAEGNKSSRKSKLSWIEDKSIEQSITPVINNINLENDWNFLLREYEPLQYTVYGSENFYDWHIDSFHNKYNNGLIRKLSFTLCLNEDYEGGELEFCLPNPKKEKHKFIKIDKKFKKGTIVVFPSFVWHKVNPVIKGIRKVLVGWIVGKPFV